MSAIACEPARVGGADLAAYHRFLEAKGKLSPERGFPCDPSEVNALLKPFQRAIVAWAVRRGRCALFESFGLGKTLQQLEFVRLILQKAGGGRGLIVLPLGVRQEFVTDGAKLGLRVRFIRSLDEAGGDGIYLTNYETVRDGKLDPRAFTVISLDEAAVLRGMGGTKTFRELMKYFEGTATYRCVATATPSPNEFIELLAYAAFLDVMDVSQAKTRWFKRNSEKADNLTLHPHKAEEFWLWVSTWAMFCQSPADLGDSDAGYDLPPLEVRWHQIASDHSRANADNRGQHRLFANAALGVVDASREKRSSLGARVDAVLDLVRAHRAAEPDAQLVIWCDLNDEQRALERALLAEGISVSSLYGSQDIEAREVLLTAWRNRETTVFLSKPSMYGAGVNLQQCHAMLFAGIGFKFAEVIQAIHRIHRFLQQHPCVVHLVYTEAESEVRAQLERKWQQHAELVATMTGIIRRYGLSAAAMETVLTRAVGVERREARGERWLLAHNDCVEETQAMDTDSVGLILTSVPFSTMYEYSPSYNDFGHTDDEAHYWAQMDFLTPQLLRVLQPGRNLVVHVKDRIEPGGVNKLGFQTVQPFHADAIFHFRRHGFAYLGMRTIVTDVVRENSQTYRLGWSEQCKDGSRMGVGMPEYLLLFRKPPTDRTNGYADAPVVKAKPLCDDHGAPAPFDSRTNWKRPVPGTGYTRARWQFDAHGFWRSAGDRLLSGEELATLPHSTLYKLWKQRSRDQVYDFAGHVRVAEEMDHLQRLPASFMLLPPHSWHPDVWTDVTRMRTLNGTQWSRGKQMHLCPLQFDTVDRVIEQMSNPDDWVYDPFGGLGTVGVRALKLGRRAYLAELNEQYWRDAVDYLKAAETDAAMPTLFDLLDAEDEALPDVPEDAGYELEPGGYRERRSEDSDPDGAPAVLVGAARE